jgi:hypothetical protein
MKPKVIAAPSLVLALAIIASTALTIQLRNDAIDNFIMLSACIGLLPTITSWLGVEPHSFFDNIGWTHVIPYLCSAGVLVAAVGARIYL